MQINRHYYFVILLSMFIAVSCSMYGALNPQTPSENLVATVDQFNGALNTLITLRQTGVIDNDTALVLDPMIRGAYSALTHATDELALRESIIATAEAEGRPLSALEQQQVDSSLVTITSFLDVTNILLRDIATRINQPDLVK